MSHPAAGRRPARPRGDARRGAVPLAAFLSCAGAAVLAWLAFGASAVGDAGRPSRLLELESDGFRYTLYVPTGAEALFDLARDPGCRENLLRAQPHRVRRLRQALLERRGAKSLDDLRAPYSTSLQTLRSLGYL